MHIVKGGDLLSSVPLPIQAGHFCSLWNDGFFNAECFDRFLIHTVQTLRIGSSHLTKVVTHLPCLDVKLKYELLLLQTFLIVGILGLFTDDWF